MAIAFDAVTVAAGTGDLSWTHTPVGTPAGILVLSSQHNLGTDAIAGVTYGAATLARSAAVFKTDGELQGCYAYFLGSGIPSGAQTIAVDTTAGQQKYAVAITVTADSQQDTAVDITGTIGPNNSLSNPSGTLATTAGVTTFVAAILASGQNATSNVAVGADYTELNEQGTGFQVHSAMRRTTNPTGGNVTYDWVAGADDVLALGVALKQTPAAPPSAAAGGAHGAMYPRMQRHIHQSWTMPRVG